MKKFLILLLSLAGTSLLAQTVTQSWDDTEDDPVVGAVSGIVKGDGAGNIAAAVEDTDFQGVLAEGAFTDGDKTKLDTVLANAAPPDGYIGTAQAHTAGGSLSMNSFSITGVPDVESAIELELRSGVGNITATTYPILLQSGDAGTTAANGSILNIFAGDGGSVSGDGGAVNIQAGDSPDPANTQAGNILLSGGDSGVGGANPSTGGSITLNGAPNNAGAGGVSILGGLSPAGATGGDVLIKAGTSSGSSADVTVQGGGPSPTSVIDGGIVNIIGGASAASTGGDVLISGGAGNPANGEVILSGGRIRTAVAATAGDDIVNWTVLQAQIAANDDYIGNAVPHTAGGSLNMANQNLTGVGVIDAFTTGALTIQGDGTTPQEASITLPAVAAGAGGSVFIAGGGSTVGGQPGGSVTINSGSGLASGVGGNINLNGNSGIDGGGSIFLTGGNDIDGVLGTGGDITIEGGEGFAATGQGGNITLSGGYGGDNSAPGGTLRLENGFNFTYSTPSYIEIAGATLTDGGSITIKTENDGTSSMASQIQLNNQTGTGGAPNGRSINIISDMSQVQDNLGTSDIFVEMLAPFDAGVAFDDMRFVFNDVGVVGDRVGGHFIVENTEEFKVVLDSQPNTPPRRKNNIIMSGEGSSLGINAGSRNVILGGDNNLIGDTIPVVNNALILGGDGNINDAYGGTIINGTDNTLEVTASNSVILVGDNITGADPDTAYVRGKVSISDANRNPVTLLFEDFENIAISDYIGANSRGRRDPKQSVRITTVADIASSLDGTYFLLYDAAGSVAFWVDVDNTGTLIPPGASAADRAVEITTILSFDNAATAASKVSTVIAADAEFTTYFEPLDTSLDKIIVVNENWGYYPIPEDGDTGFTIEPLNTWEADTTPTDQWTLIESPTAQAIDGRSLKGQFTQTSGVGGILRNVPLKSVAGLTKEHKYLRIRFDYNLTAVANSGNFVVTHLWGVKENTNITVANNIIQNLEAGAAGHMWDSSSIRFAVWNFTDSTGNGGFLAPRGLATDAIRFAPGVGSFEAIYDMSGWLPQTETGDDGVIANNLTDLDYVGIGLHQQDTGATPLDGIITYDNLELTALTAEDLENDITSLGAGGDFIVNGTLIANKVTPQVFDPALGLVNVALDRFPAVRYNQAGNIEFNWETSDENAIVEAVIILATDASSSITWNIPAANWASGAEPTPAPNTVTMYHIRSYLGVEYGVDVGDFTP